MLTVLRALQTQASERPDALAFISNRESVTWAELEQRVTIAAAGFLDGGDRVALKLEGINAVIGELAATAAGRTIVPVPGFFSDQQVAHLVRQSDASLVSELPAADGPMPDLSKNSTRIIFTSGTTGQPKGVVLGAAQVEASLLALNAALKPDLDDRYLSMLPQAQLLEQICGIFMPVLAGATTIICPEGQSLLWGGDASAFARTALMAAPTITVLSPRQLALWVAAVHAGTPAPKTLRYVAVGGAPTAPELLHEARSLGIPAHAGYGLSEACSVVALSRPGDPVDGSAGQVLEGIDVEIVNGEIVVSGPTVMDGYLGRDPVERRWHTGDLGRIERGRLWIEGRRDAMIVCSNGRNIAPEWVEAEALADPAILAAALIADNDDLVLALFPVAPFDAHALQTRLAALPTYARPSCIEILDPSHPGLVRGPGLTDRRAVAAILKTAEARAAGQKATTNAMQGAES